MVAGIAGVEGDGPAGGLGSLLVAPQAQQGRRQVALILGVPGNPGDGAADQLCGIGGPPGLQAGDAQEMECIRLVRIVLQHLVIEVGGCREVARGVALNSTLQQRSDGGLDA